MQIKDTPATTVGGFNILQVAKQAGLTVKEVWVLEGHTATCKLYPQNLEAFSKHTVLKYTLCSSRSPHSTEDASLLTPVAYGFKITKVTLDISRLPEGYLRNRPLGHEQELVTQITEDILKNYFSEYMRMATKYQLITHIEFTRVCYG